MIDGRLKMLFQTALSKIKTDALPTTQHLFQTCPITLTFSPLFALSPLDAVGF
ncbi:hypothetical protein [Neisseria sp. 74A18]|uniref:hypothetical protein n=1 Tax=Neisseria sp. 74A18 TaxID=1696094 RepID=UPI000B272C84|nr:hypothetical protein [Neisseria sp. 74A18]